MKSLVAVVALLGLFACGQAADAPSDETVQPDADSATGSDSGNQTETRAARTLPAETAPVWRTCQVDDDCELRDSVCAPLQAGGLELVCRRERAQAGEACTADNACEPGLLCNEYTDTCAPVDRRGGQTGTRKPLSCEPDGSSVDAHCETESD